MPHHVYANGREICAKSADGSSDMAVDVCHSPGAPMPGIPVPYMNSCKASDLANGSRTVFIKGMEVCLEDQSYFAKSYGDEAATQGLKKGAVSGSVQGKCRFVSWSPNVFVEGRAVTRHLDLVTHNHNSPSNTAPMVYRSNFDRNSPCEKDTDKIKDKCKPEKEHRPGEKDKEQQLVEKFMKKHPGVRRTLDRLNRGADKVGADKVGADWITDHCDGLMIKAGSLTGDEQQALKSLLEEGPQALGQVAKDMLQEAAMDVLGKFSKEAAEKAGKLLARSLTRHTVATAVGAAPAATGVGAPAVPITVTIANAVGLVLDVADGIWTGLQLAAQAPALISQVNGVFDAFKNFGGAAGELFKRYGLDPKQASWKDLLDKMKGMSTAEMVSDTMGLISRTNPCTRARRCMLVEYEETEDPKSLQGKGCCPGQTGHHLIPDKMMQGVDCPGYDYKKAPNICVEGVNQYHGSHNQIHKRLDGLVQMTPGQTIPMPTAMVVAAASVLAAFPESGCNPDCIIEQLKSHYKCQNANLNKTTGYNANEKGDARRSSGRR